MFAGDANTFLKYDVSARVMVNNKSVAISATVIMPKYKLEYAKANKAVMEERLDLALSCLYEDGEASFRRALGNPRQWSFTAHKKLFYKHTAMYVLETGSVLDEHPHFLQSSCSEHAFFFQGVLKTVNLNTLTQAAPCKTH